MLADGMGVIGSVVLKFIATHLLRSLLWLWRSCFGLLGSLGWCSTALGLRLGFGGGPEGLETLTGINPTYTVDANLPGCLSRVA